MAPCQHNEITSADQEGVVICCRCFDVFKPKPSMNEVLDKLESRKRERP